MEDHLPKLLIFDLDGTLLDTLEDLRTSLNTALATEGFPPRTPAETRRCVGNGILELLRRSCPEEPAPETLSRLHSAFMTHYSLHNADATRPYPGIPELLQEVRQRGILTAILSNKADSAVQSLCKKYFPGQFDYIQGEKPGIRRKPAPDGVLAILQAMDVPMEKALYLGDSEVDAQTAQNAGIPLALVTWGFRERRLLKTFSPQFLLDSPAELLGHL